MCAGSVAGPAGATSAEVDSITSRSRSVALRLSADFSARTRTFARIGIVLRRSTMRCTWPSDFSSSARSTVTFMTASIGPRKWLEGPLSARLVDPEPRVFPAILPRNGAQKGPPVGGGPGPPSGGRSWRWALFLKLALQDLDFVGQHGVVADQAFDLAHRMQHGGVVAAAEPPADLRQRVEGERLGEVHRHLPGPHHRA